MSADDDRVLPTVEWRFGVMCECGWTGTEREFADHHHPTTRDRVEAFLIAHPRVVFAWYWAGGFIAGVVLGGHIR